MCEDVTTAARECIAEGSARSAVHHIRGHHAEVQRRGHFKEHFKLVNLRLVFRCCDVELDEPIHRFLTRPFANAQVCWLAVGRADAAGLDAKFVQPTVLRASLSEPVRRERILDRAGKKEITQWPLDAEAVQRRLLVLPAAVANLRRRLAKFASLSRRRDWECAIQHQLRRAVIAIHMRRRER